MEKYSRGWRGAPAKGVGRATGARVQIPLSPLVSIGCLKQEFQAVFYGWHAGEHLMWKTVEYNTKYKLEKIEKHNWQ